MYYKIIEKFGPEDGKRWQSYIERRGLELTRFDSVDDMHRPDLFNPETDEDWENCVVENFRSDLIRDLNHAKKVFNRYDNAILVGVDIELKEGYAPKDGLLGYDIIDGYNSISLITNWGTDEEDCFSKYVMQNGLIADLDKALEVRNLLRNKFPEDPHAKGCTVYAVYEIDVQQDNSAMANFKRRIQTFFSPRKAR